MHWASRTGPDEHLPSTARVHHCARRRGRVRRIGVLMPLDENDPAAKPRLSAFTQSLAGLGWTDGRNVQIDVRWAGIDINRIRAVAQELVGLKPDIIMT